MGSYGMTDEVKDLRRRMKDFVDHEVFPAETALDQGLEAGPGTAEHREAEKLMSELKTEAKRRGLWALGHPAEIGGGGLPFMSFVYLNEIIGRSHYAQWAVGSLSMQDSIMLHLYANDEQRERYLRPLVAGEIYPSVGLTEPEVAGSDPTQMRTTATLDGDEWVINGHKWFTSGASTAAFTTCFAITEPEADGHRKFSVDPRAHRHPRLPRSCGRCPPWATSAASTARSATRTCGCRWATCWADGARASRSPRSGSARAASSTACAGWARPSGRSS